MGERPDRLEGVGPSRSIDYRDGDHIGSVAIMGFNLEDYEPVESRITSFWADNPMGRIITSIAHYDGDYALIKAEVYRDDADDRPTATGYAEEKRGAGNVNRTSHVENCETSAIGRALANMGYAAKGKRPSQEEMAKVERGTNPAQSAGIPKNAWKAFEKQCKSKGVDILAFNELVKESGLSDAKEIAALFAETYPEAESA